MGGMTKTLGMLLTLIILGLPKTNAEAREEKEAKILNVKMDAEIQQEVYDLCEANCIDFCLIMAIIKTESSFRSYVVSGSECYGLMQIHKINHKMLEKNLGITDILDPIQNVKSGIYILRNLFDEYDDVGMVLMAYNMGENAAKKKWDKGIYSTSYTEKVLGYQEEFYKELGW